MKKSAVDVHNHAKSGAASLSSLSDSSSNFSKKPNWKRLMSQDGNMFYANYIKKSDSPNIQKPVNLSTVKNKDIKEIFLVVNSFDRYRFGRRSSIVESLLGFQVNPFPDNCECLMVTNIIDSSIRTEYPYVREGDWFKSLDNIEVRTKNIDTLLLQYTKPTKVKVMFVGLTTDKRVDNDENREIFNFDDFICVYKDIFDINVPKEDNNPSFLTLILNQEYFKTDNNEGIFYYPYDSNNFLKKSKGSFLTLNSVLKNDLKSSPTQSELIVNKVKYFVTYGYINNILVVSAFSSEYQTSRTALSISNGFTNFIKSSVPEIDSREMKRYLSHVCAILRAFIEKKTECSTCELQFGQLFNASICMSLPKEAQLRISDALSELESMDYKRENDLEKTSRSFIVHGCAFYYSHYLMASNLTVDLRKNVEYLLRFHGIFDFVIRENVSEMYIWKEMLQWSPQRTYYLAICVHKKLILSVVLRNAISTTANKSYNLCMEEIKDTLYYLISCGIDNLTEIWINSNKRPHINTNKGNNNKSQKFKFMLCPEIDISNSLNDLASNCSAQSEERTRKQNESENVYDWQEFCSQSEPNEELVEPLLSEIENMMPLNLTTGWSNQLKFFLHLNVADSTIMQPFKPMLAHAHLKILRNAILEIHDVLQVHSHFKMLQDVSTRSNKSLMPVKEHCITIELANKEILTIVGRLFSFPHREVYICFDKIVGQNLIELAFRLSFLNIG